MPINKNNSRKLIINADDLGFSKGINNGIFQAHSEGILTSATLATNMPCAEEAAKESKKFPSLGIGIHLNVVRGKPLLEADKLPRLTDETGEFSRRFWDFLPIQLTKQKRVISEIEMEYRTQIETAKKWGITPTHLDSERHHAAWPIIFKILVKLAKEYDIGAVRVTREPYWPNAPKRNAKKNIASVALRVLTRSADKVLRSLSVASPCYFYGGCHIGEIDPSYISRLAKILPVGTHELMIHPGQDDSNVTASAKSYLDSCRGGELAALLSPVSRQVLLDAEIRLVNFSSLTALKL